MNDNILLLSQNLQWETRNYTLTGDSNAYKNFFFIRDSLETNSKYLIQLLSDNKPQQAKAVKLQQQTEQLIHITDTSLQSGKPVGIAMERFIMNVKQHLALHDAINQQVQAIRSEANRLLAARRSDVFKTIDTTNIIFIASGILILVLLAGAFMFIFYHIKKRQKAEKQLIESEKRFQILINSTRDLAIFMTDEKGSILNGMKGLKK